MADTAKLFEGTFTGSIGGNFCQNVFHLKVLDPASSSPFALAKSVGQGLFDYWKEPWLDCLPAAYVMSSIRVRQIDLGGGPTYTRTSGVAGEVGTRDTAILVSTVGPLLTFPVYTDRWTWGKVFLPGVAKEDCADNFLASGLVDNLELLAISMNTPNTQGSPGACTWVYCVKKATDDTYNVPVGFSVSATIGTQRRRAKPAF